MQVSEIVPDFAAAFPFEKFNAMQREAIPAILDSDQNVVASAPTASGKTAIAELAICKTLRNRGTALYIAPLRALTNELEREWNRFEDLGYSVYVVTGERDLDARLANRADVLVMTPEKVDSATRTHQSPRYDFLRDIDCCIIDEVHLLDSDTRGSALEVTIARLRRLCSPRIVALSATMANVMDVAEWLDAPADNTFMFGDSYRPVELNTGVKTYTRGENAFADKYRRLYRALDLVEPHLRSEGQGLVFVATRQDTVQAAMKAREKFADGEVVVGDRGEIAFHEETRLLSNKQLRDAVLDGIAFHHAGLSRSDKDAVERWFREGRVKVLFSTSTLAWGVNLPARCVVLRDTNRHDPLEGEIEMSPIDVLQMIGRAGRPEYDDVGYGWVICTPEKADRYRRLLAEGTPIESRLADDLDRHLVAEIALGTIQEVDDVFDWLDTTFYAVRSRTQTDTDGGTQSSRHVREAISSVLDRGFIASPDGQTIDATALGRLASKYYLHLDTAEQFLAYIESDTVSDQTIIQCVASAAEFSSVRARRSEQDAITDLLGGSAEEVDPGRRKTLAVLASSMNGQVPDGLTGDAWVIRQNALRLVTAFRAFCDRFGDPWMMNHARRVEARLEHGVTADAVSLTALDGIGKKRAEQLWHAGIETPVAIHDCSIQDLERAGLSRRIAETVLEHAETFPTIEVDWGSFPDRVGRGESELHEVVIRTDRGTAHVGVRVSVNGIEMTTKQSFLSGELHVPVGVFGAAEDLEFRVSVTFPRLPLQPVTAHKSVTVV